MTDEALEAIINGLTIAVNEIQTSMYHLSLWICGVWDEYKFYMLMDYQLENDLEEGEELEYDDD